MATDYWPAKEGYIFEGCMVLPCYASAGSITEMACVKLVATNAGYISVDHAAAAGDSIGVALRAANTYDIIPVAFNGVVKMIAGCTIALGDAVASGGNESAIVYDCDTFDGAAAASQHLGTALQAGGTTGDEILVLLGGQR